MNRKVEKVQRWLEDLEGSSTPSFAECLQELGEFVPALFELESTPQDPEWHAEGNVAIHTGMVLDAFYDELPDSIRGQRRAALVLGALFHDIAKPRTTCEIEIEGRTRIGAPKHAEIGRSYLATQLCELPLADAVQVGVLELVGSHHDIKTLVLRDADEAAYARVARECSFQDVVRLERADFKGRLCPDLDAQLEILDYAELQAREFGFWEAPPYTGWGEYGNSEMVARAIFDFERRTIHSEHQIGSKYYKYSAERSPVLTLLCGPSGAGKSSLADASRDAVVISLDALREEVAGSRRKQTHNGQVRQLAMERTREALRDKQDVIWDATSLRRDQRIKVLSLARDYGALTRVTAVAASPSILEARNQARQHPVRATVRARQLASLQWPTLDEAHQVDFVFFR